MSRLNPSDTALLIAMCLERVAPAKAVYKACRSAHNFTRDLLDALECVSQKFPTPPPPKE